MPGLLTIWCDKYERIGSKKMTESTYDLMRCLYNLIEEEGFINKHWARWKMFESTVEYMKLLNQHRSDLLMSIPMDSTQPLSLIDTFNGVYMTTIPWLLTSKAFHRRRQYLHRNPYTENDDEAAPVYEGANPNTVLTQATTIFFFQ